MPMSLRFAPTAFRMPTSRVRSRTETSMIFMIPMPPTRREIPAMPPAMIFMMRSQEEIAASASETTRTLSVLLASIAVVSLVVGGIGIMNIMLVSVTERTREIGIRMAIGAKSRHVLAQFLLEAVTLSLVGGAIGVALGIGVSRLIAKFAGWPVSVDPSSIAIAFGFSALIGIFFGFYPARKAAALDPIEALRYE